MKRWCFPGLLSVHNSLPCSRPPFLQKGSIPDEELAPSKQTWLQHPPSTGVPARSKLALKAHAQEHFDRVSSTLTYLMLRDNLASCLFKMKIFHRRQPLRESKVEDKCKGLVWFDCQILNRLML